MEFKTGFFTKYIYKIQEGTIHKSRYTLFGLIHKKSEDEYIDLSQVEYIYNIQLLKKMFFNKKAVELVSSQKTLYIPNRKEYIANELVDAILKNGAINTKHKYMFVPSTKSMRKLTKGYTILCDEFDDIVRKVYNSKEVAVDRVNAKKIIYLDKIKEKGFEGIAFGYVAGGGFANSIEIFGLKKAENETLYNIILLNNNKLNQSNIKIYKSNFPIFSPTRWFKQREVLMLFDWGIMHKQYNVVLNDVKYLNRTSVVEYDKVKSYLHGGLLNKKIEILGATSILTKEYFSVFAKKAIWNEFKRRKIENNKGEVYRASLFHRKGQGSIILTADNLMYKLKKETKVLKYPNIYSVDFSKPHWYSFYGDISIKGRRIDARSGEGGDVDIEITHMSARKGKRLVAKINSRQ